MVTIVWENMAVSQTSGDPWWIPGESLVDPGGCEQNRPVGDLCRSWGRDPMPRHLGAWRRMAGLSETSQGGKLNQNNQHPNLDPNDWWSFTLISSNIYTYFWKSWGLFICKQQFHMVSPHYSGYAYPLNFPRSPPSTQMAESWLWKRPWWWNNWMVIKAISWEMLGYNMVYCNPI